jgi:hypothetical protein
MILSAPTCSHLLVVVRSLTANGWRVTGVPDRGVLKRNGQKIVLKLPRGEHRIRLFVYKVTVSSRGRPEERRIEITSTYKKGLKRVRDFADVVIGYSEESKVFVGVDPRRIGEGGKTGNASTFFDREGLNWKRPKEILVRPRFAKLFSGGSEYHAFFKAPCLAEYLTRREAIHAGSYLSTTVPTRKDGSVASLAVPRNAAEDSLLTFTTGRAPPTRPQVDARLIKLFEAGRSKQLARRRISQATLMELKHRCEQIGLVGEEFVLKEERRRLRRASKAKLASKVKWISQDSAAEGYDILSFENSGQPRLIEVKATSGKQYRFPMSDGEWSSAVVNGNSYYVYRVTDALVRPRIKIFRNPVRLQAEGMLSKTPSGWWITLI